MTQAGPDPTLGVKEQAIAAYDREFGALREEVREVQQATDKRITQLQQQMAQLQQQMDDERREQEEETRRCADEFEALHAKLISAATINYLIFARQLVGDISSDDRRAREIIRARAQQRGAPAEVLNAALEIAGSQARSERNDNGHYTRVDSFTEALLTPTQKAVLELLRGRRRPRGG
jgi:hypothetical protein